MPFSSAGFVVFFGRGSTPEPCFVLVRLQMPLARVFLVILCFYRGVDSRILFLLEHTVILYFFFSFTRYRRYFWLSCQVKTGYAGTNGLSSLVNTGSTGPSRRLSIFWSS